jgi:mono/diheme cytochrome c family protein
MKRPLSWLAIGIGAIIALGAAWRVSAPQPDQRIVAMADAWPGKLQFETPYDALDPQRDMLTPDDSAPRFDAADDYSGLPRTTGHETVAGLCGACHSLQLVMQQRGDTARWDTLVTQMTEKHGMAPLDSAERADVVAYLSRHFPSDLKREN